MTYQGNSDNYPQLFRMNYKTMFCTNMFLSEKPHLITNCDNRGSQKINTVQVVTPGFAGEIHYLLLQGI